MNRDQLALETYRNSFAGPTRLAAGSVTLFDNTLRDGEQTPGVAFTTAEKVAIGRLLAETGIPALEAGFAAVSAEEREAIRAVVDAQTGMTVFSLCRCVEADVAAACACGVEHVTVYTPVSELQLRRRLQVDFTVVQDRIRRVVAAAKSRGLFVRFSCEEAFRTPPERLVSSYLTAKEVGADMLSLPDTVGVATPWAVERCLALLQREVGLPVSVHFHNDLGLSVANALAAMLAGATEVQVCANGLGERAGNTPLEQVALAALYQLDYDFGVNLEKLTELSTLVSKAAGTEPASNQPIFGANVFTHESGAHLHGLLQSPACYEPFPPPLVGREHRFVLGKHSGRAAVRHVLSGWLPEAVRLGGKHVAAPAVAVQQEALFEQVKLEWVAVDFGGVRVERCRQFGGPWLGLELIRTLGLDEFLKRKLPQGQEQIPWALMALVLVLARLCDPSSELHLAEHGYEELVGAGPIIGCALTRDIALSLLAVPCSWWLTGAAFAYFDGRALRRRRARLREQLPSALITIAGALQAGRTVEQSLELAGDSLLPPLGEELGQTCRELALGVSLDEALLGLRDRCAVEELDIAVCGLTMHDRLGGDLVGFFRSTAELSTARDNVRQELWAASAAPLDDAADPGAVGVAVPARHGDQAARRRRH